jgi:hypothetical protein
MQYKLHWCGRTLAIWAPPLHVGITIKTVSTEASLIPRPSCVQHSTLHETLKTWRYRDLGMSHWYGTSYAWQAVCSVKCTCMHSVLLPFVFSDSKQLVKQYIVLIMEGEILSSIYQFRPSIRLLIWWIKVASTRQCLYKRACLEGKKKNSVQGNNTNAKRKTLYEMLSKKY